MQLKLRGKNLGIPNQTVCLPYPWESSHMQDALLLINDIYVPVMGGDLSLKAAVTTASTSGQTTGSTDQASWPTIVAAYKNHLQTSKNRIPDSTYDCNYRPYYDVALKVLSSRNAPATGTELISAVLSAERTSTKPGKLYGTPLTPWANQTHSRYACCLALKNLLEFAFEKHNVAKSWRIGPNDYQDLLGPKERGRPKASLTDAEIVHLIKAVEPRNQRWANVLKLLAAYGLREWEINHLEVKINHKGEQLMYCRKGKVSSHKGRKQENPPRWLHDLPLELPDGTKVKWDLKSRWQEGTLELPDTIDGKSFGQWLRRQPEWKALQRHYEDKGEHLKPYAFRDSFSVRCTREGINDAYASVVMGHTPEVHRRAYRTSNQEDIDASFIRAEES